MTFPSLQCAAFAGQLQRTASHAMATPASQHELTAMAHDCHRWANTADAHGKPQLEQLLVACYESLMVVLSESHAVAAEFILGAVAAAAHTIETTLDRHTRCEDVALAACYHELQIGLALARSAAVNQPDTVVPADQLRRAKKNSTD